MEINRENLLSLIKSGIKRGVMSVSGLERESGVPKDTIRDFMRGKTHVLRADKLQKILNILEPGHKLRIIGYIEADAQIHMYDTSSKQENNEEVPCPPECDPSDVLAVRIQGDGMLPAYHDGWIIYYSRNHNLAIPAISGGWQVPYAKADKESPSPFSIFLDKPCVIGLADGRTMIGTLRVSKQNKGYDITNYNDANIQNIRPVWAARIIFIKTG